MIMNFAVIMMIVIPTFIAADLMVSQVEANEFSPKAGSSLAAASGLINPLASSTRLSPSSISSLQPEWQSLEFPILPPPRMGASLTLNPVNKIALLFGGHNSSHGELNDLWITDGFGWMQFFTPHSPGERSGASMAYDEARQVAVLFGGSGNQTLLGDTWLFNGVDWIQQYPKTSPSPRSVFSMAYDPDQGQIVLFGGLADMGGKYWEALNDTWIWDGTNWQQISPAITPPARLGANMVYDQAHRSIVLFGGGVGGGLLDDTWVWDGTTWSEQEPSHRPPARINFGMAYDEARQQVVLFGGQSHVGMVNDTWTWDGKDWQQLLTRQSPPEELAYGAQLVYMPRLRTTILYNDLSQKNTTPDINPIIIERSEVWRLTYQNLIFLPITQGQ